MKLNRYLPLFALSLSLFSCGRNDMKNDDKGAFVSAEARYGENNSILFGDILEKDDFNFVLKYEKKDVEVSSEDFEFSIDKDSTFTNDDINATLTLKKDQSIKADVKITPKARDTLKLLFIGNSFSDDTIQWMYEIASSLGINVQIENMYIGGCSIDTHYNNILGNSPSYEWVHRVNNSWIRTAKTALSPIIASQDWDFISFQQASGVSGIPTSYSKLQLLMDEVKLYLMDEFHTQFVWNMTWAYQSDSTHAEFPKYNSNQMQMYQAICNAVQSQVLTKEDIKTIIPNGTAIQNARTSYVGDRLTRDGYHLSLGLGRYIAGLNAIKALTGANIDDCSYSPVDNEQTLIAKESVDNAIAKNFEVTNSTHLENPMSLDKIKQTHYLMEVEWFKGFWNATGSKPAEVNYVDVAFDNGFYCTEEIPSSSFPDGTIIYVKAGYKYRPEAWYERGQKMTTRPGLTQAEFTEVNSTWRGSYKWRAFNVSRNDGAVLSDQEKTDIASGEIFAIYLPNE